MYSLQSALSAMRTSQQALQTVGNNIANTNTPGYHRQQVDLVDRRPFITGGLSIGQGVDVGQIRRLRDASVESALLQTNADQGQLNAQLETLRHIESLLTPGQGTLHARMQDFFNQWELLAAEPDEGVRRQEVLQSAVSIADGINSLAGSLSNLKQGLQEEIDSAVAEVNRLSKDVATLNYEIRLAKARGVTPNDLLDQRDQLVTQLAGLLDAEVVDAGATQGVRLANGESFITTRAQEFSVRVDPVNGVQLYVDGIANSVQLNSGRLAGLIESHNTLVGNVEDQLEEFASGLVQAVNKIHASGLGAEGGLTHFNSTRPVIPTNVPLTQADTDFAIDNGELFIAVTEQSTGTRTLHRVPVNPAVDSLDDLGAALNAIGGISASVNALSGQLSITAASGFTFDFTGALPTQAAVVSATGTSIPVVAGQYRGEGNDELTLVVNGTGSVGVDAGVLLEVYDQNGVLKESLSVGQGYAPGDPLDLADGVILRVPAGSLVHGDTFRIPLVAEPDTAGVLTAIGAHDLFTGTAPGTLAVNRSLLDNPGRLAVSQTGEAGDNRIAVRLAALGRQPTLAGGTATFNEFLSLASSESGVLVAHTTSELAGLTQLAEYYSAERESISGVNPDEELVRMLEFQRLFQSAARFLTTVNETLDEVLGIIK